MKSRLSMKSGWQIWPVPAYCVSPCNYSASAVISLSLPPPAPGGAGLANESVRGRGRNYGGLQITDHCFASNETSARWLLKNFLALPHAKHGGAPGWLSGGGGAA